MIYLSKSEFRAVFPALLSFWPEGGGWTADRKEQLVAALAALPRTAEARSIRINPRISKQQLEKAAERLDALWSKTAGYTSIPWKYQKYLNHSTPLRQQAIKMRPGARIPLALGGVETVAYVNSVRRVKKSGQPYYLKTDLTINTEHVPIILERESKCDCVYCGTRPTGDETSCLACGAPLPEC